MHRRQCNAEIGVALVRADHDTARFGQREVHAGHGSVRAEELLAQVNPCGGGELGRIAEAHRCPEMLGERLPYFLLREVDRRRDNVARMFATQLHDALAKVGVHYVEAALFEVGVEAALLGEHRLALHQVPDIRSHEDVVHEPVVLLGIARPVHGGAVRGRSSLERDEVFVEMRERVLLDVRRKLPEHLPLRHLVDGAITLLAREPDGAVMPIDACVIGEKGGRRVGVIDGRAIEHGQRARGDGAHVAEPARISATCIIGMARPSARASPSRCMRQDTSVETTASACPAR